MTALRRRVLPILTAAATLAPAAHAGSHEEIVITLPAGAGPVTATAGDLETRIAVEEGGSDVAFNYDIYEIWGSMHTSLPDRLHPEARGVNISVKRYAEPTVGSVIFPYGEEGCTDRVLEIAKDGFAFNALIGGAKESLENTVRAGAFLFSAAGLPASWVVSAVADIGKLALTSDSKEDFLQGLLVWATQESVQAVVAKFGDLDDFFDAVVGEGIEDLTNTLSGLLVDEPLRASCSFNHTGCGVLFITYEMFAQHEDVPRDTVPASALLTVTGDCTGHSGDFTSIGDFSLVAEFEVRLGDLQKGLTSTSIDLRAVNPQIVINAQCHYNPDDFVIRLPEEEPGKGRPSWVDDDMVSVADWNDDHQACYDAFRLSYQAWYEARLRYRKTVDRIDYLTRNLRAWRADMDSLAVGQGAATEDAFRRAKAIVDRAEAELAVRVASVPGLDAAVLVRAEALKTPVQECIDRYRHTSGGNTIGNLFGEVLMDILVNAPY